MLLKRKDLLEFDGYVIDRPRWLLQWQNEPITLNRKTFDLLLYLVDHRDRVVSKDELLQALWPNQFVEESNLTQHVFLLRKALSRHDSGTKIIDTVPGRGYRFAAVVTQAQPETVETTDHLVIDARQSITRVVIEEEADTAEVASPHSLLPKPPETFPHGRTWWIVAAAGVLILILVASWLGWQRWQDHAGGAPISVVLTPMDGTTGDPVLDRALVDALRMDLAQSPFVSVVASARVRATLTQMMHKPDEPLTPAIARDVCERTDGQAVLQGSISRAGQRYLLTEEATSCVNGAILAETKQEAASAEELPRGIDKLAEGLRQKLGESRRSIARFDAPLVAMNTASLEALKTYSQASRDSEVGKTAEAIALLKTTIATDPNFTAAYYDLAAFLGSTGDFAGEREAIQRAYAIRDSATEPVRLAITGLYISAVTKDLYAAERNYRSWTELYPRSASAWNGLSVTQRDLGRHADSLVSADRALALRPMNQGLYTNLAYAQFRTSQPAKARVTCERAIAQGLDGDMVRGSLLEAAYTLNDAAQLQAQRAWGAAHPEAFFCRVEEAEIAIAEGRFTDAHRLIAEFAEVFRQKGLASVADSILHSEGANLMEAGDLEEGRRLFHGTPPDPEAEATVDGLLMSGELPAAQATLRTMQTKYPQGTIWNQYMAPYAKAFAAMAAHKPKDAIAALETSRPLEARDFGHPMLRAEAYRAAGELDQAAAEYHRIVDHREVFATAIEVPLSWLGLGRSLAAQGNRTGAVDAYRHFFTLWSHADPDAKILVEARQEFAKL